MKYPEVLIRLAFCSSVSLCGTNREQIFGLPKSSRTMVCAVFLIMPKFSAIKSYRQSPILYQHLSHFIDHFWNSACRWPTRTWLILSRFLPVAKMFEPFVNMFSALGFPHVHLQQHFTCLRCSFPQFLVDYVQLAAVDLQCWSHAVYAVCRFSCLWRTMLMRAYMSKVAVQIWYHSPNF